MAFPPVARACALAVLVAALTGACGDDGDDAATPTTTTASTAPGASSSTTAEPTTTSTTLAETLIEVAFANGQVVGGSRRESVAVGDRVRIRVTSDVADEVHVHTYDVVADVMPGQPADLVLTATIPGRHEVELEDRRKQLLELEVR